MSEAVDDFVEKYDKQCQRTGIMSRVAPRAWSGLAKHIDNECGAVNFAMSRDVFKGTYTSEQMEIASESGQTLLLKFDPNRYEVIAIPAGGQQPLLTLAIDTDGRFRKSAKDKPAEGINFDAITKKVLEFFLQDPE
jgi:hypothetical protein